MNPITKQTYCTFPECAGSLIFQQTSRRLRHAATVSFLLCILMSVWVGYREFYTRQLEVENMRLIMLIQQLTIPARNEGTNSPANAVQIIGNTWWLNLAGYQNKDGHASHGVEKTNYLGSLRNSSDGH